MKTILIFKKIKGNSNCILFNYFLAFKYIFWESKYTYEKIWLDDEHADHSLCNLFAAPKFIIDKTSI